LAGSLGGADKRRAHPSSRRAAARVQVTKARIGPRDGGAAIKQPLFLASREIVAMVEQSIDKDVSSAAQEGIF